MFSEKCAVTNNGRTKRVRKITGTRSLTSILSNTINRTGLLLNMMRRTIISVPPRKSTRLTTGRLLRANFNCVRNNNSINDDGTKTMIAFRVVSNLLSGQQVLLCQTGISFARLRTFCRRLMRPIFHLSNNMIINLLRPNHNLLRLHRDRKWCSAVNRMLRRIVVTVSR